jgi:hypothetical protein
MGPTATSVVSDLAAASLVVRFRRASGTALEFPDRPPVSR